MVWVIPWLAIFPDKETMTAIALKPSPGTSHSAADVPLSVQVRGATDGGAYVLFADAASPVLAGAGMPTLVAAELAALPGLLERALA